MSVEIISLKSLLDFVKKNPQIPHRKAQIMLKYILIIPFAFQIAFGQCEIFHANIPAGFQGISWGSSIKKVKSLYPKLQQTMKENPGDNLLSYFNADYNNHIEFYFLRDKGLQAVFKFYERDSSFISLLDTFYAKHGYGSKSLWDKSIILENGEEAKKTTIVWYGSKTDIKMTSIEWEGKNVLTYFAYYNPKYRNIYYEQASLFYIMRKVDRSEPECPELGRAYASFDWGTDFLEVASKSSNPKITTDKNIPNIKILSDILATAGAKRYYFFCNDRLTKVQLYFTYLQVQAFYGDKDNFLQAFNNNDYGAALMPEEGQMYTPKAYRNINEAQYFVETWKYTGNHNTDFYIELLTEQNIGHEVARNGFDFAILTIKSKDSK